MLGRVAAQPARRQTAAASNRGACDGGERRPHCRTSASIRCVCTPSEGKPVKVPLSRMSSRKWAITGVGTTYLHEAVHC